MHTLRATREGIFQASELPYSLTRPMHTEHPNLEFMVAEYYVLVRSESCSYFRVHTLFYAH